MKIEKISTLAADLFGQISIKLHNSPVFATVFLLIFFVTFILICLLVFFAGKKFGRTEARNEFDLILKANRKDAVKRSRAVLSGQMAEQIAPFLKDFPCNPADVRFVGKPLDFIGFPGASDGSGINEILFIEVKTGNSALSAREKEIKAAVEAGNVRYIEYNPEVDFSGA